MMARPPLSPLLAKEGMGEVKKIDQNPAHPPLGKERD